jgi:hypothetical protein
MHTKKPFLRVTKWLSGTIPLQAECTACSSEQFNAQFDPRQPSRDHYARLLQQQFEHHLAIAHGKAVQDAAIEQADDTPQD